MGQPTGTNDLHWNPTRMIQRVGRIEREDATIIDEEEAEAELASDEGLIRHLAPRSRRSRRRART